jgi:hypothetical protein
VFVKKPLSMTALLSFALTASAAGSHGGPGPVKFVSYVNTGIVYVYIPVAGVTAVPACGQANVGSTTYDYVIDGTTAAGKSMLAGIIAAQAAGQTVWFYGTGDCTVLAGTETLAMITTSN